MTVTLRASNFGSCIRAQVADQLGKKPLPTSTRMQALYDRGNTHENACLDEMKRDGWELRTPGVTVCPSLSTDSDQHYLELVGDTWVVTGHLDGIGALLFGARDRVVEVKSPPTWERFEKAIRTHSFADDPYLNQIAWQISVYMVGAGLEAVIACWDEEHGVRTFGIETPPYGPGAITARALEITALVTAGRLPDTCSQVDFPCPYAYLHDTPDVVEDAVLDELAGDYELLSGAIKANTSIRDSVRDDILAHGGGITETFKVTVSEATTARYDYQAIEKALGRPLDEFKTETVSPRVRVTRRESLDSPPT